MIIVILTLLVFAVLGALLCFQGKKLFYPLMAVTLFCLGLAVGTHFFGAELKGALIGLGIGLVLAVVAKFVYKFLLFCAGALLGVYLGGLLSGLLNAGDYALYVRIGCAVLVGLVAVSLGDQMIIALTAASGALSLATIGLFLYGNYTSLASFAGEGAVATANNVSTALQNVSLTSGNTLPVLIAAGVLFLAGFFAQQKKKKKSDD